MTRVAIVVLTWNGRDDTLACLASLRHVEWPDLDVIVADNASSDGTERAVRDRFPDVEIVQNGANLGFAEGNNRGIRRALDRGADAVLVLNNDTTVAPDVVRSLLAASAPGVAAVSPVIRYAEPPHGIWFAGAAYDPKRGWAGRPSAWERGRRPLPAGPTAIDRVVGAAMLVSREAWERVGLFDPALFYLYEDVDWSLRARRAGYEVRLDPKTTVLHHVAASQSGHPYSPLTQYYGTRNDLEVGRRYGSASRRREAVCVLGHVSAALLFASRSRVAVARAALRGWKDYRHGRLGRDSSDGAP